MRCAACGHEDVPLTRIAADGRLIRQCQKCQAQLAEPAEIHGGPPQAPPKPVEPPPIGRRTRRRAAADGSAPLDIVKAAKARLRWLNRGLKRLKKLEQERTELQRLLDAASGKPAVVRNIKRTG